MRIQRRTWSLQIGFKEGWNFFEKWSQLRHRKRNRKKKRTFRQGNSLTKNWGLWGGGELESREGEVCINNGKEIQYAWGLKIEYEVRFDYIIKGINYQAIICFFSHVFMNTTILHVIVIVRYNPNLVFSMYFIYIFFYCQMEWGWLTLVEDIRSTYILISSDVIKFLFSMK